MSLVYLISESWWHLKETAHKVWLVLRHRPLLKCPICKGKGGEMSGYEEPEWSECGCCWHRWEDLEDHGWTWFCGRVPVWVYVQARLSIWSGLWYCCRARDLIRCKLGIHRWMSEEHDIPGRQTCCVCYESKRRN